MPDLTYQPTVVRCGACSGGIVNAGTAVDPEPGDCLVCDGMGAVPAAGFSWCSTCHGHTAPKTRDNAEMYCTNCDGHGVTNDA